MSKDSNICILLSFLFMISYNNNNIIIGYIMERLILEYTVGDGYTYSAENTVPIIYKDKQSAIDDFTLLLLEHIDALEIHRVQSEHLYSQQSKLHKKMLNVQRHPKKDKQQEEITQQFYEAHKAYVEHQKKLATTFMFGGTELQYSDFLYRADDETKDKVFEPRICTLDEFYFYAEQNMNQTPVKKDKIRIK